MIGRGCSNPLMLAYTARDNLVLSATPSPYPHRSTEEVRMQEAGILAASHVWTIATATTGPPPGLPPAPYLPPCSKVPKELGNNSPKFTYCLLSAGANIPSTCMNTGFSGIPDISQAGAGDIVKNACPGNVAARDAWGRGSSGGRGFMGAGVLGTSSRAVLRLSCPRIPVSQGI